MKKIARRLASAVRNFLHRQRQMLRRRALSANISHTFCLLEPRRVLSVSADLVSGVLTVNITDNIGTTEAALIADGTDFFLDENSSGTLDGLEEFGTIASLQQVVVNGSDAC